MLALEVAQTASMRWVVSLLRQYQHEGEFAQRIVSRMSTPSSTNAAIARKAAGMVLAKMLAMPTIVTHPARGVAEKDTGTAVS